MPASLKTYCRCCLLALTLICLATSLHAQLQADFSMDKPGGCSPVVIHFTNTTTGASANALYNWDFGNGNTSSLQNGGAIYITEQTYNVTLTVKDGANTSIKTTQVSVYKNPIVDFSSSVSTGCLPLSIVFTGNADPGSGTDSTYTWDFGDGNTQQTTDSIQSHIYSVVQNPIISLTVTNNFGCHSTLHKTGLVSVLPGVTASFNSDKNYLCLITDPVQFTNTSSGPGTLTYLWNFGDGNTSTQINPQYIFNKKGIYTVTLHVNSSDGCVSNDTLSSTLNVASYNTDFNVPDTICNGSQILFKNNSIPLASASTWTVDGSPVASTDSLYYIFSAPGSHPVTLTNIYGSCSQLVTKNVVVNAPPSPAGFTYVPQGKCGPPQDVIFTDISNATSHQWDFDYHNYDPYISSTAGQPTFTYTTSDYYHQIWLKSTSLAGCSDTIIQPIYLPNPIAGISFSGNETSCGAVTQTFSTGALNITSYLWNFDDGSTSTDASPTHTFTKEQTYVISLTYTTQDGCTKTTNTSIRVALPFQVDFSASDTVVCGNTLEYFYPVSTDSTLAVDYVWCFGDGTCDYHALHNYSSPGNFTISVTASNDGCVSTLTKSNFITVAPLFFHLTGYTNTCEGDRGTIDILGSSTGADRLIWNFGDGTIDTTAGNLINDFKYHYTLDGAFGMTVTAINDASGCTFPLGLPVAVLHKEQPVLKADQTSICASDILNVEVDYPIVPNSQPAYDYFNVSFLYGDYTPFTGNITPPGNYWPNTGQGSLSAFNGGEKDLAVITTTDFGCVDTSNFVPLQIRGAKAGFVIAKDTQCFQSPFILKDTSSVDPGNSITSRLWNFGDGTFLNTGGTISHTYNSPGNYNVQLTVTDASGCAATSASNITSNIVANGPLAAFTTSGNNVPLNTTVSFYNSTNIFGSSNASYLWNFGDGSSTTDYNPSHTYTTAGNYTAQLTTTDLITGCSSTAMVKIHVSNFNSSFTLMKTSVSGSCPPILVNFTNTSVNYTSVSWNFGDGVTASNLNNVSHVYKDNGTYIVTLTVYGANNLQDQIIDSITVTSPSASIVVSPLQACIGSIVIDTAFEMNTVGYEWDFGDGSVMNTSTPSSSHQYLSSGIYTPNLIVQDSNGCLSSIAPSAEINIHPNPVASISPATGVLCQGSALTLQAEGGSSYQWTPAAGLSNDAIATPLASPRVTTKYVVHVVDDIGCKDSTSALVTVINPGKLQVNNDTAVCQGDAAPLYASGENNYSWINTTDGLSSTTISNPVAHPAATTTYTVTGTDENNCFTDTAYVTVQVFPLPTVSAGQDTTIQAGASIVLQGSGSGDIAEWNWVPARYLSCSDCALPLCTTKETITYTLTATSGNGCSASAHVNIKLECDEARIAIPGAFTPNHDGLNDIFQIKGISFIKHMVIFDRWGEKVFEKNNFDPADPASCWDGSLNGMPASTGTYVYFVEMQCPSGGAFSRKGTILLIR